LDLISWPRFATHSISVTTSLVMESNTILQNAQNVNISGTPNFNNIGSVTNIYVEGKDGLEILKRFFSSAVEFGTSIQDPDHYQTIQPISSSACQDLVSTTGGASTYVNFVNKLDIDAKAFWIDFSGKRVIYATVKPGQTFRQQTYVGHPWEVTTNDGYKALIMPTETEFTAFLDFPTISALLPQDCQNLLSVSGGATTTLIITNRLKVDAQLYWIGFQGNRVLYTTIRPGTTVDQETFVGHPWEVVAAPNFKKVYLPIEGKAKIVLEDS